MADKKSKEESGLRTVQRALDILYCFSEERQELTLTDISKEMNLAMSTTTRLLKALEMNHFVEKNPRDNEIPVGSKTLSPRIHCWEVHQIEGTGKTTHVRTS